MEKIEPFVKISREKLEELEAAEAKLNALEAAGVDNWARALSAMLFLLS